MSFYMFLSLVAPSCSVSPLTSTLSPSHFVYKWSLRHPHFSESDVSLYIVHLPNCSFLDSQEKKMDKSEELKLTQMKNFVQKLGSSTEKYGDPTLQRFLIARSMDPNKAAKMFVSWQKWRGSFVPLGFIPDSEVTDQLEAKTIYLQGLSKDGFPVMILKASKHYPARDQPQFKKFVVHMLDKVIASGFKGKEIGNEKFIAVLDLNQICYKNVDSRGLITGFQFLQAYYPERLAKLYILNMPWFFVSIWKMVSRFLEKATLEKVVMVSNEEEKNKFIKDIGEEVLPEEFGGKAKLTAIQDVLPSSLED